MAAPLQNTRYKFGFGYTPPVLQNTRYPFGFGYVQPKAPAASSTAAASTGAPSASPSGPTLPAKQVANLGNAYAQLNPGWTPPAGTVPKGVTVTPSPASDPVKPFMTGQDIINYGDAFKSHEDQIAQANSQLEDVKAQAQTALYNIGRNYLQGTENTQDDAAARGIFQSSIKDGSLADLAATKASLASDVNTRVNNAQLFHDTALQNINNWFNNFQEGMNSIEVQNAAAIPGTPAAATKFGNAAAPKPAATPSATPSAPTATPSAPTATSFTPKGTGAFWSAMNQPKPVGAFWSAMNQPHG